MVQSVEAPDRTLSDIEERMPDPTARGLATAVGRAISDGRLNDGDKLAPIRTVARQLGLSPTTVSAAWGLLARAGTLRTAGRRGTVVTTRQPGPSRYRRTLRPVGDATSSSQHASEEQLLALDLSTGTPDPALLPDLSTTLQRLEPPAEPGTYLDQPVLPELAELLRLDWPYTAEQITIVDGAMDAIQLIAATHLRYGDRVAIEHPSFPPLLDLLDATGATAVAVDVDDDGAVPAQLSAAVHSGVRAVFIQPRAQNPTGASLTPERADELTQILRDTDVLVVEDDSAGPIAMTPPISLGRAIPSRTLHVRSYSKPYGPDLRIAALAGPAHLIEPIIDRRLLGQGWTSRLLQAVLVDLLTQSAAVRAVRRARHVYAQRRAAIVAGLSSAGVHVGGKDGLNIWVPVADETTAQLFLATQGIGASPGHPFAAREDHSPHLRITAGRVTGGYSDVAKALAEASRAGMRTVAR